MRETEAVADARRAMEICNACRYCEGFCAVFPAMELRREFAAADLSYLANLCHGCRGCFYACQYAPPHEFGINLPKSFAEVRAESYEQYAWPQPLARLLKRNGTVVSLVAAMGVALVLVLTALLQSPGVLTGTHTGPGAFFAVIPYSVMVWVASATFLYALLALAMSAVNFWRDAGAGSPRGKPLLQAVRDALTLKNLGGGGDGCNYPDESFSGVRKWLHHAMFYGFMLCFASTSVATVFHHFLGWVAPYSLLSAPVILGTLGGLGMVVGTFGLIWMKVIADPAPAARALLGGEYALLFLLLMVALTGLVLLALRATGAMGVALAVHLGFVLALFLMLPYSKFVHGIHRSAALLRAAMER
ncbi:tricarballylate utilization 4Fe-4S protein TcuB [Limobrevibacterium gyesilva]|uniref:Tricarballylate utilization 4Fe-4S protein TcuB n=1 Tax=Limobrevibacterium gyesilva TaxID=2991712 RepID=A0AA41YW21_9PROT|nr:tricarballylate utilization 4Fe-4S protein TcuB [Limobrevibacterium gyesilva]MCW3476427.1 tricarballylate utilization 4Fe-4S protein TcuB [Limobrevibacterium gyesilva]